MTPAQIAKIMSLVDHYGNAIMLHDFAETTRARAELEAALRDAPQAEADGWVMVPRRATEEMIEAAEQVEDLYRRGTPQTWTAVYRAMLAERPSAPTAVEPTAEEVSVVEPISVDEQRLLLWQAIQRITYGNKTDDKLIVAELHKAGFCIAARASKGTI